MPTVEIITENKDFYNLKYEWNFLLEQIGGKTIYLTWEWLYTWWETFHDNRELFILTVRDNGKLVGIAPLLVRHFKYFWLLPFKRVEFLGTGEDENDEVCSNYMDFIVSNERLDIYNDIFDYLTKNLSSGIWDEVVFSSLPEASAMHNKLSEYFSRNNKAATQFKYKIVNQSECAIINLPENWENYLSSLDTNWRHQIRSGRRQLEKKGKVETVRVADCQSADSALDDFIKLHQKRWQNTNGITLFSSEKFANFHHRILDRFFEKQRAGFSFLKVNGKIVAASYRFFFNNTVYAYLSAYDPDVENRVGIGILERSYDIEFAINNGYKIYDFYKAKDGSYKWHLAKDKRTVCDIHIFRKELKYYLLTGIKQLKTLLKAIKTLCLGNQKV